MKKINYLLLTGLVIILGGCQNTSGTKELAKQKIDGADAAFTVWLDRSTRFSKYDYTLTDEKEALSDITEKLALETTTIFDSGRTLIKEEMLTDSVTQNPEKFIIFSDATQANVTSQIEFVDEQGNYLSYGTVSQKYQYLEEIEKVKLKEQELIIYNATIDGSFKGKNLEQTLQAIVELFKIDKVDERIQTFLKETYDKETLKGQTKYLYNSAIENGENQPIEKIVGAEYNNKGSLSCIYARVVDYRETLE